MTATPLISIVLPIYNGSRHVDQAIESVVAQTIDDWELIVVDDASTDETPQKIAAWADRDSRIKTVRLAENRKLPGALNEGFGRAAGRFFTWTSDDNWYAPEALARLLEALRAEPDVDVVYSDYTLVDADGAVIGLETVGPREDLVLGNCVGPCFLMRSPVFDRLGGYDEDLFLTEDYDFWLRASLEFSFLPLGEPLYFYRRHGESLSARQEHGVSVAAEKALLGWLPRATWLTRRLRGRGFEALGLRALIRGDVKAGRRHLIRAMLLLRRPPLFRQCRSYAVDWLAGPRLGNWVRRLRKPPSE